MPKNAIRIVKRIGNALLSLICVALMAVIGLTVYAKATGKQVFRTSVLWVLTDSMADAIPARSYILVETVDPQEIQVGDIITFYSRDPAIAGSLNSHRVVEILGDHEEFRTKGDNNPGVDNATVLASDVVARYVKNLPLLTKLGRLFATTGGLILTFSLILVSCVIWITLRLVRNAKRRKQEEIDRLVAEEVKRLQQTQGQEPDAR